ncbi:MAG: type II secretion system F family protein [Geminicoccaceae bacterium]|nr:type II secretion system F family protein [Geminicoccaceae bacterium]
MTLYAYRALNERGRAVRGRLTAGNERELHHLLQESGLELVDCRNQERQRALFRPGGAVTNRILVQFCMQLEQMLHAGIPLRETLGQLRDNAAVPRLRDALTEICRDLGEGKPLSAAFARHPRIFGPVFVALIDAGEETGHLEEALARLQRHHAWADQMTLRVKKAVRYPAFMGLMVVAVTSFMMLFVVPQVVDFLTNNGQELPAITLALIATSGFFVDFWWLLAGLPAAAAAVFVLGRRASSGFVLASDRMLLRVPALGPILRQLDLARFAHMLAIMYRTGIPILEALAACSRLVRNRGIRESVDLIGERIAAGENLSKAMTHAGVFPPVVVRLIAVGESSGDLDRMLEIVAADFDRDTDEAIGRLVGMIEPALTLIMGGMMGWIALGVFGPVYDSVAALEF